MIGTLILNLRDNRPYVVIKDDGEDILARTVDPLDLKDMRLKRINNRLLGLGEQFYIIGYSRYLGREVALDASRRKL